MGSKEDLALEEEFAQKRMSASTFRRLAHYVGPYKRMFCINLLFTILATLSRAMALDCSAVVNPYGDGESSARIVSVLAALPPRAGLSKKHFHLIEAHRG